MVEGLERLLRRLLILPLFLPVLLFGGWGLGKVTARGIALPDGAPIRIAAAASTPRAQLEALSAFMADVRSEGMDTEEYVLLYQNHVRPVEHSLKRWGLKPEVAREVAWPLVENAYERGLDPAMVVAIVLVESSGRPNATSFVGARGLMQIMPLHEGHWECGSDMYAIESNLCYGTSILAWNLDRYGGDERRALLAYNGCVRGTNTPNCHTYPDKVRRVRERVRREWQKLGPSGLDALLIGSTSTGATPATTVRDVRRATPSIPAVSGP
jgi:soluble lytic murein transglycosylase-like protein